MKKLRIIYLPVLIFCCCTLQAQNKATTYLVEGEDFQFKGGWMAERNADKSISGSNILRVLSGKTPAVDALTVLDIKQAGTYSVWTRTPDYPKDRPGTRLFRVYVNEQPMDNESGKHGREGYYWEKTGTVTLEKGETVIRLKDTRNNFARCDALLLAADAAFNPNDADIAALKAVRISPVQITAAAAPGPAIPAVANIQSATPAAAEISNDILKLQFREVKNEKGETRLVSQTFYKQQGTWNNINAVNEENRVFVLAAEQPQIGFGNFFPSWNNSLGYSRFTVKGKEYEALEGDNGKDPFMAGKLQECIPVAVKKISDTILDVTYQAADGQQIQAKWLLSPQASHVKLTLQLTAKKTAYYSMVVTALQSIANGSVNSIQLPPMFQYQRIPAKPVMLPSAMMPQPLAMVEAKGTAGTFTTFVTAAPETFPVDWAMASTSRIGFSIKNAANEVQPVALSPVLGLSDSKLSAGQTLRRAFTIGVVADGWNTALEYISDHIYAVKDYRTQQNTSLTETAFNIIDLIKNDTASGWDAAMKGFYDIEADPKTSATVVQAAPLAVIETAILSRDEALYISRALPTIEYTLSRSGFRWAKAVTPTSYNTNPESLRLSPYNSQFTTAYYAGLYKLLQKANPWLMDIALPGNQVRNANGYSVEIPSWTQQLAAYRLTGNNKWLTAAKTGATKFLATDVYGSKTVPLTKQPFYNTSFYSYWWELPDLFEITRDSTWLKAAEASAFHTLAGVRVYPSVRDTLQTIHTGNVFEGNTTLWWKGNSKYRLGFPRVPGDAPEKKVPESIVSPVGLGFEQPFTFFESGKLVRHVFMSSWAPHLLRLYQYDNKKIFETYARNAVIGRFTNYPGYYATGFTDITMQQDFPYKGPDVSSIYYHHIPPHLAFTIDFLVTEAIQRSKGKIHFPYEKQDGFVWFNNRVFGGEPGTVFSDNNVRLWMKRGLAHVNRPEVNYVTAISDNCFWILLMNEAADAIQTTVQLGNEVLVAQHAAATVHTVAASATSVIKTNNKQLQVSVPAKELVAISLPLEHKSVLPTVTPVRNGMKVADLGAPWGKCYVFRIRSPFGWDSVYGYMESGPVRGASVAVTINDHTIDVMTYPYEWSFYKLDPGKSIACKLQWQGADGVAHDTIIEMDK